MKKLLLGLVSVSVLWGQLAFADNHPNAEGEEPQAERQTKVCLLCKGSTCGRDWKQKYAPIVYPDDDVTSSGRFERNLAAAGCNKGDLFVFRASAVDRFLVQSVCDFDKNTHFIPSEFPGSQSFVCSYVGYVRDKAKVPIWKK